MAVPTYDHIIVVMMENHDYSEIIGNPQAPYINSLAAGGALLSNYSAITHPSQPNYFALYAGSTFGIADDNPYTETGPTLATILQGAGKTFAGYVEHPNSAYRSQPVGIVSRGHQRRTGLRHLPHSRQLLHPAHGVVRHPEQG